MQIRILDTQHEALPGQAREVLGQISHIKAIAEKYYYCMNRLFLGKKYNCPTALEIALRLKKVSYIHGYTFVDFWLRN